ncbi:MAG TPA: hypothetical protein VIF62_15380 [Labilithrix sp.]
MRILRAASFVVALAFAPTAHAQEAPRHEPSASDFATARTALKEGLALREKGNLEAAAARMQTAYDLVRTPVTAFELGKTELLLGHVLTAHELFQVVVRMPLAVEESARSAAAREEASRLSTDIEPRIPVLRLHIKLAPGASAVVHVDDDVVQAKGDVAERAVDPGKHEVVAKAGDGPEQRVFVTVAESEKKDVDLAPVWVAPKPPPPPPGREIVYVRQTNPLVFIGIVGATAGLVATTLFTIVSLNNASRAKDVCGQDYCSSKNQSAYVNGADATAAGAWVSAGATIGFGVMAIVGINTPIRERVSKVTPYVGPGAAGVTGSF